VTLPEVVSFYTPSYKAEADRLIASLDRHDMDYYIKPMDDTGSWETNCNLKPDFIEYALRFLNRPVLWIDADGELMEIPSLLDGIDADFAVHQNHRGFHSGTLYFAPTDGARRLLDKWRIMAKARPRIWDQVLLKQAWDSLTEKPRTLWLPVPYLTKIDNPRGAVVLHHQAARRLKRKRGGGAGGRASCPRGAVVLR